MSEPWRYSKKDKVLEQRCAELHSRADQGIQSILGDDMCSCSQVLSQGFKQHLGWCKGRRQEACASTGAEGEEGAEDEESEGDPQELAAIEASKVLGPIFSA